MKNLPRRLLAAFALLALGAAAWWITRPAERGDEGLVVHVEARDEAGHPLARAQVQRVFAGPAERLDQEGRARLTHVVLRELDVPSPEALARALVVRAPYHALRRGERPTLTPRADGSWTLQIVLRAHGLFRLYVDPADQGEAKAFIEGGGPDVLWEPIAGRQVARSGSPASYRVFGGAGDLSVRMEGVPDREGTVSVATRKFRFAPPAPGHVVEHVLKPEAVAQILGRIVLENGTGAKPPTLRGTVRFSQIEDDGRRIPLALVPIHDDGSFLARRTGKGRYALVAKLALVPGTTTLEAAGGDEVEIRPTGPAAFALLAHPGLDTRQRRAIFALGLGEGAQGIPAAGIVPDLGRTFIALPDAGAYDVTMRVAGTDAQAPLVGTGHVPAGQEGRPVALAIREVPHGTLVVETTKASWTHARGGTLECLGRHATLLRGLKPSVTLRNLPAGEVVLTLQWDNDPGVESRARVRIKAGGTTKVTLARPAAGDGTK